MADTIDYEHSLTPPNTVTITSHEGQTAEVPLPAVGGFTPRTEPTVLRPTSITAATVGTAEPARWVGALGTVISAIIGVVVVFGYDVPPDLEKQLLTMLGALAVLWPALTEALRGKVVPVAKAQALVDTAYVMDSTDPRTVKPSIT